MRILYLCQRFPFPPDRGDKIPTYHHIKYLSRHHDVYVATLTESALERRFVQTVRRMGATALVARRTRLTSLWGMALSFLTGEPLTLGYFRRRSLMHKVRDFLIEVPIDAIVVFSSSMAQYVENQGGQTRVIHFCDVDSQKWKDLAEKSPSALKRFVYAREAALLLAYEKRIAAEFSASCLVTQREVDLFSRLIPGATPQVLQNGVDFEFFSRVKRQPEANYFVFIGVMNYPPNVEAVIYFVERIWPLIRERYPDARFSIVGGKPVAEVLELARRPGVEVTDYVVDVRPYLERAALVVIPLDVARGIQNKVLEGMAAGAPVLTTPVTAEGLDPAAKNCVFVCERDPETFFATIKNLLDRPDRRETGARQGQDLVRKNYSWAQRAEQLLSIIREAQKVSAEASVRVSENEFAAEAKARNEIDSWTGFSGSENRAMAVSAQWVPISSVWEKASMEVGLS